MKMKKYFILFLSCLLLLCACSSKSDEIAVESNVEDFDMNNFTIPEEVRIEANQLLYDQNNLKIATDSLESDSLETYLSLNIENLSDEDIYLVCESSSVNNFMIESAFTVDLPAGESILTGMPFSNADLNACGIDTITNISFTLGAYDIAESTLLYETDQLDIQTNMYGSYEQTVNTDGTSIYDKNNIQIISKGFSIDSEYGDVIVLLVMNHSDNNIYLGTEEGTAKANNTTYEASFGCNVPAGHNAIQYIYFLDEEGISAHDVSDVSVIFTLTDVDSWEVIDTTPTITFSKPE